MDAVCPLVTKVHHEVRVRAGKGFRVVYVGHEGHDEAVGTMAVAPESISLVSEPADVARLDDFDAPVAVLAQTTLSHRDWSDVAAAAKDRFGDVWVLRVNAAAELPDDLSGTVGVTAGASAPEELVEAVIARLAPAGGTTEVTITDEDEYFPPPRELRDLLDALASAVHASLAVAPSAQVSAADRTTAASDVLATLAATAV